MSRPTVTGIYVSWSFIKSLVDDNDLVVHYTEDDVKYNIQVYNGSTLYKTSLIKEGVDIGGDGWNETQNTSDRTDFLTNYAPYANSLERTAIRIENTEELNVNIQGQALSNKLRYDKMTANQSLTEDSYTTVYTYSGSGQFYGFYGNILDDSSEIKVTVDGEDIIADFEIDDIPVGGPGNSGGGAFGSPFLKRSSSNEFAMEPPMAIQFSTSVTIQIKAHHNSSNHRKLANGYVVITKES